MTHDEIIQRAAKSKSIDFQGFINYFSGYYGNPDSALLVLDPPMGEITCLELFDLMAALAGKTIRLQITVVDPDN